MTTLDDQLADMLVGQYDLTLMDSWRNLQDEDYEIARLLVREHHYQQQTLSLVAASSPPDRSAVLAEGTPFAGVTAEGYPGKRFHPGTRYADSLESLAVRRAIELFGAKHANVQPHSGSSANLAVIFSVLSPGERILSMDLDAGGHLTHGATASVTSKYFDINHYGIGPDGWLDYAEIRDLAHRTKPKLIICGASSYPRQIDFVEFHRIADEVDAYLLADISHISGLVAAGEHPSPIDHAHFTTTSSYKQLNGPRGGLILVGQRGTERVRDATHTVSKLVERSVFPGFQGTPNFAAIAAKAVSLRKAAQSYFQERMIQVRVLADAMAATFKKSGVPVVTDGTDTHMVLVDLRSYPTLTGKGVEDLLGECSVLVNRNRLPGDERPAMVTSGLRFGSNELAARQVPVPRVEDLVDKIAQLVIIASTAPSPEAPETVRAKTELTEYVRYLCARYPVSNG